MLLSVDARRDSIRVCFNLFTVRFDFC